MHAQPASLTGLLSTPSSNADSETTIIRGGDPIQDFELVEGKFRSRTEWLTREVWKGDVSLSQFWQLAIFNANRNMPV